MIGDVRSGRSGPNCAGALGRLKGPLAALAAVAPLTRPARSPLHTAVTGATACQFDLLALIILS